jgi:uncharacterized coiled-coil protein SlyX
LGTAVTYNNPGEGAVKVPSWVMRWVIIPALIGALGTLTLDFFNNVGEQKAQDAQIQTMKEDIAAIKAEQKVNSEYRVQMLEWQRNFQQQYSKDMQAVIAGHQQILNELQEHERQERVRNHKEKL